MVRFAVAAFDFDSGALIFVVSLVVSLASDLDSGALIFVVSSVAALHTRRYWFTASVHCAPIFKTFLAAHCFS